MNKIRVIDLLNKIANGEEVPKEIWCGGNRYKYNPFRQDYDSVITDNKDLLHNIGITRNLNHKVEIIEEDKEIEELRIKQEKNIKNNWKWKIEDTEHDYNISTPQKIMGEKINELIKAVNELKKGK